MKWKSFMVDIKKMLADNGPSKTFDMAREAAREYAYKLRAEGKLSFSETPGHTSIHIVRRTVPEIWEDVTMALLGLGQEQHTHYDPKDKNGEYTSFPSIEATTTMHIVEPFGEPRFHKHFLGGWMGFGDYKAEIEGVKDGWMIQPPMVAEKLKQGKFAEVKGDERWNYTYSQRLRAFPFFDIKGNLQTVNQLEQVVKTLKREPTARSAQCVTWDPKWDPNTGEVKDAAGNPAVWDDYHSPCLQRFWFRLQPIEKGYRLHVNGHWRSRDHLKAVPSNIFGVTEGIHEQVRLRLQEELGVSVERGSYIDINDSLHLYGHYFDPRKAGLDAEPYLNDVFRIASGEPISERVVMPGTDMHDIMMEDIKKEYDFRKASPNYGNDAAGKE